FGARLAGTNEGPFLRTGDLGFFHAGELYVSGRQKDLIILGGRNHYPQDLELCAEEAHSGVRRRCVAAFSVEVDCAEAAALVAEFDGKPDECEAAIHAIRRAVTQARQVDLHAVALLSPTTIAKTSSGKIQRHACRDGLLAGTLSTVAKWTAKLRSESASET